MSDSPTNDTLTAILHAVRLTFVITDHIVVLFNILKGTSGRVLDNECKENLESKGSIIMDRVLVLIHTFNGYDFRTVANDLGCFQILKVTQFDPTFTLLCDFVIEYREGVNA